MTGWLRRRRDRRDRGSISVELAILLPGFVYLIVLAVVTGRQVMAQGAIDLAAHDAARAASLSRTAPLAQTRARAAALDTLAQQGLACNQLTVTVNTAGFAVPVGTPASVSVTVVCHVSFADLAALPGVPGGRTLTASFVSPLDEYRART
ncbi:MAG TPA: TadE/TadG family type IV pilus assembly protein [Rugosimonospora sp.]|nr:TadE/TadG family type IV pilus assembly protein [Rugosimonospora sp.]